MVLLVDSGVSCIETVLFLSIYPTHNVLFVEQTSRGSEKRRKGATGGPVYSLEKLFNDLRYANTYAGSE